VGTKKPVHELRRRVADYRHLRTVTRDRKMLENIDRIIAETEEKVRRLDQEALDALSAEYARVRPA
jgi:hypothetical protein